jgi:hypothetical protein
MLGAGRRHMVKKRLFGMVEEAEMPGWLTNGFIKGFRHHRAAAGRFS